MDIQTSQRVYGMLSYLLQYPDEDWKQWLYAARLEADLLPAAALRQQLHQFLDEAERMDQISWQDLYVQTFDFGKQSNMYLTYAEHGEERERGPALIALKRMYEEAGFAMSAGELPDYLPLVLEFAASAPWPVAASVLGRHHDALLSIRQELSQMASPYTVLFDLLLQMVPDEGDLSANASGRDVH